METIKIIKILQDQINTTHTLYSYVINTEGFILANASKEIFNFILKEKELINFYNRIESFFYNNKGILDKLEFLSFKYNNHGFDDFTVLIRKIKRTAILISLIPFDLNESLKNEFVKTVEKISNLFN